MPGLVCGFHAAVGIGAAEHAGWYGNEDCYYGALAGRALFRLSSWTMEDVIHPVHLEALKRATPAQKLEAVAALYEAGIRLRMAGLRMTHPDWTDDQLRSEARRSLRHAGT